ncbi:caspase family protein [Bradyrhizobium sp. S69]|uniref:caspase family protein n=1 Tax=Bradyrhizobium sp. S69 TaxID=1641856 RepID=UPI00131C7F73|nr:caspase family protein [Bradyrhizobium sp. S69]
MLLTQPTNGVAMLRLRGDPTLRADAMVRCLGRRIVATAIVTGIVLACSAPAEALGNRIALVVGNANYKNAPHLYTPINDAQDLATMLTGLGFEVTLRNDTRLADLQQALRDFSEKSAKADIAILYFAGYSISNGHDGYLIPVDAEIGAAASFQKETVPLYKATLGLARAHTLGLVILDALHGNPFTAQPEKPDSRDLEAPGGAAETSRNVLLFFATGPGKTAEDGKGRNSPLAAALLKYLPRKDLEISFLFRNIRDEVRTSTAQKQTPYMYGQLSREKIFINGSPTASPGPASSSLDPFKVQPCDQLAAATDDASKNPAVKGINLEDIKSGDAQSACAQAVTQFPNVGRFHYQLGRSLFAAKDYPAALKSYKKAFELGNIAALYALGAMYDDGIGVDKDPARARFYYEIAAQGEFAPAMVSLGAQHERGVGTAVDPAKAYDFYQRAAALGDARAINKLGVFAEKGLAVTQDVKRARSYYEKSATLGDSEAMVNLARCFANGIGGRKDIGAARQWLAKAASAGSAEAKQILAAVDKPDRK